MATHPHAVLVNIDPVTLVRAHNASDIASDNGHCPGLRVVLLRWEVSVDICFDGEPRVHDSTVGGACLLQDVGGWESRGYLLRVDAVLNALQVLFVLIVEDGSHLDGSPTRGAELVGVGLGEVAEAGFHDVGGEIRNFEECWLVTAHGSVPCLGGVDLGLHSDLVTVNFVRRKTGVSVTPDNALGVIVFISREADEHPQPAFEHGGVNTREGHSRQDRWDMGPQ